MKRLLTLLLCALPLTGYAQKPSDTPASQMEKLDRGLVVIKYPAGKGFKYFASWRLLGTDDQNTTFALLKNGEVLKDNICQATSVDDISASATDKFQVVTYRNGNAVETSPEVTPWAKYYLEVKLDKPANGALGGSYSPNDCSVGDVDGDGQYEIFVKWDPSNSKDNSQSDKTDNVYIDCYKLDGTKLWRIDLGVNIRAGAHYTQFMVYDFDRDGKAELMCKTAPGSKDGLGNYVNQAATDDNIKAADNSKDWRTSAGRINGGQEYLTVFNGLTGAAIHTVAYYPNRNAKAQLSEAAGTFNWDDRSGKSDKGDYGNRGERYLATVACLSGPDAPASAVFCRGYYTYAYLWAVDFDGTQLKTRWLHSSYSKTSYKLMDANGQEQTLQGTACTSGMGRNTMYANGNHNLSVADVDGDGKDEIIWGSAALDDDGKMLYAVGFGHGDAIHLGDLNPDRPGLELFDVHEEKGDYAWDMHDAATGEILWKGGQKGQDNGRGLAADIVGSSRGYEFWSSYGGFKNDSRDQNPYSAISGKQAASSKPSMNFRIYWDGDALDELLDGTTISKYGGSALGVGTSNITGQSNNGTKATPNLSADIFGDWREELILRNSSNDALNIFSTITPTDYRVPTLMHDHTYRLAVAWQNVAYNQPPHLGYYLPDYIDSFQGNDPTDIRPPSISPEGESTEASPWGGLEGVAWYTLDGRRLSGKPTTKGVYIQNGKKFIIR
jgi:rhamnogalacturonan endolyase